MASFRCQTYLAGPFGEIAKLMAMPPAKNSYTYQELLECGNGVMFGQGNAQLPLPSMLMFDRITHISDRGGEYGKGEIVAELDIRPDLWFFSCHFPGDPVMPGWNVLFENTPFIHPASSL